MTRKFFLTNETRALGQEHWYWDDQEVTANGITLSGGTVALDAIDRKLIVHLDQSGLWGSGQEIVATHWVKFSGTDVFGTTKETKILVQTPPVALHYKGLAPSLPFPLAPLGDPPWERVAQLRDELAAAVTGLLAAQVGPAEAGALGRSIGDALTTGQGRLDAVGANGLLSLLGQRGLGP